MADVRIQQYPQKSIVSDNDIFLIADSNDVDVNGFLKYKKVRAKDLPSIVNTAESITYANLIASIAADDLIIGTFYKITDSTSGVSPLLVQAVGIDAIGYLAFDAANPLVTINYDVITDTIRWSLNQTVAPVPTNRTITAGTGLTGGGDLTANRTFAIDSTVTTLTGTQTLTNKTLTSPIISEVLDSNGNEILGFTPIASATDYITIKNGIGVGVPVHISATGSSTNIGLHLEPKGSGLVQISDGTDTTKGIRFRSSGSATSAVTLIDAVSSAGRVITLPNATGTLALTSDLTAYVPTTRTVSTTSPIIGGGALSSDLTLSIPQSSGSVNGYLSSTDWTTFNAKQNAITLTTTGTSGAATLVGATLNIPNYADTDTGITSLNGLTALTQTFAVGTSGTDFGISSATSTHTFNLPTASASNRGALSSADWTTFNNKQNALTNPITGTGTTNYLPKFTGASALGNSLLQETTNAIGLNVTPKAWGNNNKVFETTFSTSLLGRSDLSGLGRNFFYNSSDIPIYSNNGFASGYFQADGEHLWVSAASGTAGNTISFAQTMTLKANGNVGIGTTTPSAKLSTYISTNSRNGHYIFGDNGGANESIGYRTENANGTGLFIGTNGYNYSSGLGTANESLLYSIGNVALILGTNSTERMRITSAGNVLIGTTTDAGYKLDVNGTARVQSALTVGTGLSLNNATAPASGIEFPATQVASASANNLDDYEEGTFTPTSSGGITINTIPNATYTKIGNIVTFQIWIKVDITSVNFVISGLPFATSGRTSASVSNISNGQVISNQVVNNEIYGYSAVVGLDDDLLIGGNYRVA